MDQTVGLPRPCAHWDFSKPFSPTQKPSWANKTTPIFLLHPLMFNIFAPEKIVGLMITFLLGMAYFQERSVKLRGSRYSRNPWNFDMKQKRFLLASKLTKELRRTLLVQGNVRSFVTGWKKHLAKGIDMYRYVCIYCLYVYIYIYIYSCMFYCHFSFPPVANNSAK